MSNFVLKKGLIKKGHRAEIVNTAGGEKIDAEVGAWDIRKLSFVKSYFSLYKIFKSDVVYCTTGQTFFGIIKYAPFVLLSRLLGKKTVVHVKGGFLKRSYEDMSAFKKRISKFVLSRYNGGIVLSKSLRNLLEEFLPDDKIYIQHNFIQDSLIIPKKEILKQKKHDKLRIFYLSNLMKEKGIVELLGALETLNKNKIPFEAKIAGHIPKDGQDLLEKMDNIENLEYLGVVQKEAKTELLSWGNVFCLPTYYSMEGQPISIIEAMGFGNVILTTKHAGIPDICSEKNGVFVEKREASSIYKQLEYLSKNLEWVKETGIYNMQQAQELYTEDAFVHGILKIFEDV
ncbi:glycosyltransferase family 4 protein [Winogradskyella sp. F6397]|uniref:Glycosyltransferase family 4 protein n=1 Tax=Winogradskyella marina TaxID=2785530 RepID=A0ABS0EF36_9FLAO|nr:glycosyltransferase family 4 protein [Winogradskyella marina]MBF8149004.1 glycosyltransferase family 4 protein [Winogradskyella marina]